MILQELMLLPPQSINALMINVVSTSVNFFHNLSIKQSEMGHILYHRGANTLSAPCSI